MNKMIRDYQEAKATDAKADLPRLNFREAVERFRAEHGNNPEKKPLIEAVERFQTADLEGTRNILIGVFQRQIEEAEFLIEEATYAVADAICLPDMPNQKETLAHLKEFLEFQRYLVTEAHSMIAETERRFEIATTDKGEVCR